MKRTSQIIQLHIIQLLKRTFFLLGACSLLALFSGNKASAEVIVTDCGTVYYTLDGVFSEEELMELQYDLTKSDCPDLVKRKIRIKRKMTAIKATLRLSKSSSTNKD